ncbi:uncharacterized protein B0J16DRAFT_318840 [Fusarium flagelliforme]|uniref:uncharacterized protein n=1 Tax=Fusarium flagelliforme TaxID=2675880 RepID=UPI001E8EA2F3|nr:uncharacterized protein B0J16DRAFT_318840 [Fusarium flagelliforme]KAH7189203.1 hypothetical protein B0J16DRAFT_318840 [Fusarium flagelliforme]
MVPRDGGRYGYFVVLGRVPIYKLSIDSVQFSYLGSNYNEMMDPHERSKKAAMLFYLGLELVHDRARWDSGSAGHGHTTKGNPGPWSRGCQAKDWTITAERKRRIEMVTEFISQRQSSRVETRACETTPNLHCKLQAPKSESPGPALLPLHNRRYDAWKQRLSPIIRLQENANGREMPLKWFLHVHGRGIPRGPSSWDLIDSTP